MTQLETTGLPNYGVAPVAVADSYAPAVLDRLATDAAQVIARYPQARSALLPLLHLVQSVDGYVTTRGIEFCATTLGLSTAEVSGVATFYTQFKRHPNGDYTVGVCTNTLCAIMGGDEIWEAVSAHLGIGHDETTPDGTITLERIECNAACDYAPVVMVNWEFFDDQTPASAVALAAALRARQPVRPTRGAATVCTFKQVSRVLAGFPDGRVHEGLGAGPASLAGLRVARERGWAAPDPEPHQPEPHEPQPPQSESTESEQAAGPAPHQAPQQPAQGHQAPSRRQPARTETQPSRQASGRPAAAGLHTSTDAPANEPDELPTAEPATAPPQAAARKGPAPRQRRRTPRDSGEGRTP